MWNYMFFIFHLDRKEANDFSYIEQKVAEKMLVNDLTFMPVGQSLELPEHLDQRREDDGY